jgi:hypothetical protein
MCTPAIFPLSALPCYPSPLSQLSRPPPIHTHTSPPQLSRLQRTPSPNPLGRQGRPHRPTRNPGIRPHPSTPWTPRAAHCTAESPRTSPCAGTGGRTRARAGPGSGPASPPLPTPRCGKARWCGGGTTAVHTHTHIHTYTPMAPAPPQGTSGETKHVSLAGRGEGGGGGPPTQGLGAHASRQAGAAEAQARQATHTAGCCTGALVSGAATGEAGPALPVAGPGSRSLSSPSGSPTAPVRLPGERSCSTGTGRAAAAATRGKSGVRHKARRHRDGRQKRMR